MAAPPAAARAAAARLGVWALNIPVFSPRPTILAHQPSSCSRDGRDVFLCFESFSDELEGQPTAALAAGRGWASQGPLAAVGLLVGPRLLTLARPDATRSQRRRKIARFLLASLVIFLLCFVPYNATLAAWAATR